jgi:hypothetical protein
MANVIAHLTPSSHGSTAKDNGKIAFLKFEMFSGHFKLFPPKLSKLLIRAKRENILSQFIFAKTR